MQNNYEDIIDALMIVLSLYERVVNLSPVQKEYHEALRDISNPHYHHNGVLIKIESIINIGVNRRPVDVNNN